MELLTFGERGLPVLVFPTARGRFFDYENAGMIHVLAGKIDARHIQVFCVDSVDSESWYNHSVHPRQRVLRQIAYENYVLFEVVPFITGHNGSQQICVTGCGFGGYQAFNFAMRHPDVTSGCITMSAVFDVKSLLDGYYDQDVYFNNPVDYLPNMSDSWFLERYVRMRIVLAAADWDTSLGENRRMSEILGRKQIPHWLDIWTGGEPDDWSLWQRMAVKFF